MKNPIDEYITHKTAAFPFQRQASGGFAGAAQAAQHAPGMMQGLLGSAGKKMLEEVPKGVGAGLASLGIGAAAGAVTKLHEALTKRRDFQAMLEHNPHLAEAQAQDPKRFNQLFTTLRTFNPGFSADPIVAGTYMDRMVQNPQGAGAIATEALTARDKTRQPINDLFHAGVLKGIGGRSA